MAKNDNSVNIESAKGADGERYHHGDLRSALIDEGLKRLEEAPVEVLSLREIARNVGVSATAVYRHFPDKQALLHALADVGGDRMAHAFEVAMAAERPGKEAFDAMGRAYVKFALRNPSLFKLMMSPEMSRGIAAEGAPRTRGMRMLTDALREMSGGKMSSELQNIRRLQAWSIVHGLAMLMLDGLVPAEEHIIEQVLKAGGP